MRRHPPLLQPAPSFARRRARRRSSPQPRLGSGAGPPGKPRGRSAHRPDARRRAGRRPIVIDGVLAEPVWQTPGAGGFTQRDPFDGQPASEPTTVWIAFDLDNLYVAARLTDSEPEKDHRPPRPPRRVRRIRLVRRRLRSLSRPPQRILLRGQSLRLDRGRDPVQRRGDRRDLGRDLGERRPDRRAGLDRRDPHPLRPAPLQAPGRPGLGRQLPAGDQAQERGGPFRLGAEGAKRARLALRRPDRAHGHRRGPAPRDLAVRPVAGELPSEEPGNPFRTGQRRSRRTPASTSRAG